MTDGRVRQGHARSVLVTGGAGFIGSHLVDALVRRGDRVTVLDDLSTGRLDNVATGVELVVGDVADGDVVRRAVAGAEVVFHLAAHRAVLRSVEDPLSTDRVNVHGTLTVLDAARRAGVRRVVYASSSSVYGGTAPLPTSEDAPMNPRSPYAVSKVAGEAYCRVFSHLFDLETISLRYFNVYGPRQRSDSAYAAVIPLFEHALASGQRPLIYGDGRQTRDFTYVDDAVEANLAAAEAPSSQCSGRAYNVSGGHRVSLLDVLGVLSELIGGRSDPEFTDSRPGDVRHSEADLSAARADLGYRPSVALVDGLARTASVDELQG